MIGEIIVGIVIAATVVAVSLIAYYFLSGVPPASKTVIAPFSGTEENQAQFMFFHTSWCPWSKKAEQPWNSLKQFLKNTPKKYGGVTVILEDIDAENNVGKASKYQVDKYPTFKLQGPTKVYEMLGTPSVPAFRAFLINSLGPESS